MVRPRSLDLLDLLSLLVREHSDFRMNLKALRQALDGPDYMKAADLITRLKDELRQHIIDEEARILKVLIDAHGREGAQEAIKTFQEHRTIYRLVEELEKPASRIPQVLSSKIEDLAGLLETHIKAEEGHIFPWAADTFRRRSG